MSYLLSIDVEDWFHAHNMRPAIDSTEWEECEHRVEKNTQRILDLLDYHETKATFFVLGWVADRYPELIVSIDDRGHEIASHGYNHELLYEQSPAAVRRDIERSLDVLDPVVSQPIRGYRAPSFSITDWAVGILADLGFEYDSSSYAVESHDRYGTLDGVGTNTFETLPNGLTEAQLPQLGSGHVQIPWAGGGYFRVLPYRLFSHGVNQIGKQQPFIFYLHPWEIDPNQPRQHEIPWSYRLRHYTNLDRMYRRLDRLLGDFDWQPISAAL